MKALKPIRKQQTGAVLYVGLIMLVLLALIGITALQVAALQERMSANYQAGGMAFENAEAEARKKETNLKSTVAGGSVPVTTVPPRDCTSAFDPVAWTGATPSVRRQDLCFSWGGLDVPTDESEKTDQIYQITAYQTDRAGSTNAESVVDTVFIP